MNRFNGNNDLPVSKDSSSAAGGKALASKVVDTSSGEYIKQKIDGVSNPTISVDPASSNDQVPVSVVMPNDGSHIVDLSNNNPYAAEADHNSITDKDLDISEAANAEGQKRPIAIDSPNGTPVAIPVRVVTSRSDSDKNSQSHEDGTANVTGNPELEDAHATTTPVVSVVQRWVFDEPRKGFRTCAKRGEEARAFEGDNFETAPQLSSQGELTVGFAVGNAHFLLYYSPEFPKETNREIPVRVYLVVPSLEELNIPKRQHAFSIRQDSEGSVFIIDDVFESDYEDLHALFWTSGKSMAVAALELASRWVRYTQQFGFAPAQYSPDRQYIGQTGAPRRGAVTLHSARFMDGRVSRGQFPPQGCSKIVFSNRAMMQIYTETQSRITTETGGLLLGHYVNDVWYVVEACEPGYNGDFQFAYHAGDGQYENRQLQVLSRLYKHPLSFLGMWHRHPGSLDRFSGTDDITNWRYVGQCTAPGGCISGLVNYDPDFRLTFYYCQQSPKMRMIYTQVDIEYGDNRFPPDLGIMALASMRDVDQRNWR